MVSDIINCINLQKLSQNHHLMSPAATWSGISGDCWRPPWSSCRACRTWTFSWSVPPPCRGPAGTPLYGPQWWSLGRVLQFCNGRVKSKHQIYINIFIFATLILDVTFHSNSHISRQAIFVQYFWPPKVKYTLTHRLLLMRRNKMLIFKEYIY